MAKSHANRKAAKPEQSSSPFVQITKSLYLSVSPCASNFPIEGLCAEHISPLLLTYYPPFEGVVLSYSNPKISEHPQEAQASNNGEVQTVFSRSIDEYGVTYVWLTAEFLVFRPKRGTLLEGHVTLQNESILGLLCYNYFNAGIQAEKLVKDWKWNGDAFEDVSGKVVDGKLTFKVEDFEASGTESIQISGTLLF